MAKEKAKDTSESLSDVRKELDGKIEKKLSMEMGGLALGAIGIMPISQAIICPNPPQADLNLTGRCG